VPLARAIAVSTDDALRHLPAGKTVVTGYPVRPSFAETSRESGRRRFQLPDDASVLCVVGGSQGARSINQALGRCLPNLLARYHVLHVCGERRLAETQAIVSSLSPDLQTRYQLYPYLHEREMADALASADLVLSRSGASVVGELPAVGAPAVLVPFPDPAVHQRENAAYLADRGAAVILEDAELADRLCEVLASLLSDKERLTQMAAASRALARPRAAADIAALIASVAA
jgi:UDP-N-acetylglucosamine--N-acetylmuramyl-(pentapeptide) pyrophosphoryl-undecaprenol N-acetylglucosamine transferase